MSEKTNTNSFMMIEGLPESVGKCECFCCELDKLQNEDSEKEIWNRAIEEAAKLAETSKGYPTPVSQNILRLKK